MCMWCKGLCVRACVRERGDVRKQAEGKINRRKTGERGECEPVLQFTANFFEACLTCKYGAR